MQSKCVIVGGGLSGLSAAVYLAQAGHKVELFESSPKLGGRAYSFLENGDIIDNGQHIMMGCYRETLGFLHTIGSGDKLSIQERLKVDFICRNKGLTPLKTGHSPYPVNLLLALLSYKALSFSRRLEIVRLFSKLTIIKPEEDLTILQWLKKEKQSPEAIKAFWEILSVGALNTDISRASASMFASILKEMFLKGNHAASIILPRTGLSELYCEDSARFICQNGGSIMLSEAVREIEIKDNKVQKIILQNREVTGFDYVISAVPYFAFRRIFPEELVRSLNLENIFYSSILSLNIWMKDNPFAGEFYGLIDSPVQWVFNHRNYITIVISNAEAIIDKSKEDLEDLILSELVEFFPEFRKDAVLRTKLIKEKRATFVPSPDIIKHRPGTVTPVKNLFLAGDWTQTGLPATIEGAVRSGRKAALEALKYYGNS